VYILFACSSTFIQVTRTVRIVDQTSGKEFTLMLEFW